MQGHLRWFLSEVWCMGHIVQCAMMLLDGVTWSTCLDHCSSSYFASLTPWRPIIPIEKVDLSCWCLARSLYECILYIKLNQHVAGMCTTCRLGWYMDVHHSTPASATAWLSDKWTSLHKSECHQFCPSSSTRHHQPCYLVWTTHYNCTHLSTSIAYIL